MRTSIGGISLLNIFIVFFIILAFILTGIVMYYKGYKVNSKIIDSLEKFEGYNEYSAEDINRVLNSLGYKKSGRQNRCVVSDDEADECLVFSDYDYKLSCSPDNKSGSDHKYIKYRVTTYIFIDLPLGIGTVKLPITTRSNPIYQFTGYENGLGC